MRRASRALQSRGLRVALAALLAVVVAEAAVLLLSPQAEFPAPLPVAEDRFFDPDEVAAAREYRADQRTLFLIRLGLQTIVLIGLALGWSRAARRVLDALERRPVLGGALAGASISLLLALVALPPAILAHENAVDVGISTQAFVDWLADRGKTIGIAALLSAAGAALLLAVQRRLRRTWWVPAAGAIVLYAVVISWLAPVVFAPLFNNFEQLPPGSARDSVVELGDRAGVEIGEVLVVDASRRVTSLNAYVGGIGPTKQVVLFDNLLDGVESPALRSIIAHELGHVKNRDIPRGILFVAIIAPFGMLFVRELGGALAARSGAATGTPAALPAYVLAITIAVFGIGIAGNQLSRAVEERADQFALELTEDPQGLIDLQTSLAERNLSDPDPPVWVRELLRTHPTTVERIGTALAFEDQVEREGLSGREGTQ